MGIRARVSPEFRNGCAKVWYQSEGFDTEPRWASGAVFGLRMQREIGSGGPISDLGLFQSVK
jgi:hypothetical protein